MSENEETRPAIENRLVEMLESFRRFTQECHNCQEEVPQNWQFCAHCGARLSTRCPACGEPLPPSGGRFCPNCGLEIPAAAE